MITDCIEESGSGPDPARVEEIAGLFYREHEIPEDYKLTVIFLNNPDIREYKNKLFQRDEETDVISVLIEEDFDGEYQWGEIYVSSEKAESEASRLGIPRDDELFLYIVHGLFHLIGYEDTTEQQRREMWDAQLAFLQQCGFDSVTFLEDSDF